MSWWKRILARYTPTFRTFGRVDWGSPTLVGPRETVGDCVLAHEESPGYMWFDTRLRVRDGDIGVWEMPTLSGQDRYATKWKIRVDGLDWICCKYFAQLKTDYQVEHARVVAEMRWAPGLRNRANPKLSARLATEMQELRANPPDRPDLVVFNRDLVDHAEIRAAIWQHLMKWRASA